MGWRAAAFVLYTHTATTRLSPAIGPSCLPHSLTLCSPCFDATPQVAEGCASLEEALGLLQGAGSPALAPQLATDISAAVDGFAVQRVLDQLRSTSPTAPDAASARRRALRMLRELLARSSTASAPTRARGGLLGSEAGGACSGVTADYVRLVVDCLGSWELTAMADWDAVARSPSSAHWYGSACRSSGGGSCCCCC